MAGYRSAVGAGTGPGEEHVLDFTTGPRQGPLRRFFFTAQGFQGQEGVRQHHKRHMMVPAIPTIRGAPAFQASSPEKSRRSRNCRHSNQAARKQLRRRDWTHWYSQLQISSSRS